MRREFIVILLGIISISTLSSLFSSYAQIDSDKVLLVTVVDVVGAGNFSYWQILGHKGPLLVELISLSGDADLYVSDTTRPSYEVDKNNFSSTTCGHDLVYVPIGFPRPIGIGVFGHWSYTYSEYSIQVFHDMSGPISEEQVTAVELSSQGGEKTETESRPSKNPKAEENKPQFLRLLNILDMMFEMFIL